MGLISKTSIFRTWLLFLFIPLVCLECTGSGKGGEKAPRSSSNEGKSTESSSSSSSSRGKELYVDNCASCHQSDGRGVPHMYPPLRGTKYVQGSEEELIRIVLNGLNGKIEVKGKTYHRSMPAQDQLSNEKIARILSYIRQNLGNDAGPVSAEKVAKVRKEGKKD